jgi:hypothetical protein
MRTVGFDGHNPVMLLSHTRNAAPTSAFVDGEAAMMRGALVLLAAALAVPAAPVVARALGPGGSSPAQTTLPAPDAERSSGGWQGPTSSWIDQAQSTGMHSMTGMSDASQMQGMMHSSRMRQMMQSTMGGRGGESMMGGSGGSRPR